MKHETNRRGFFGLLAVAPTTLKSAIGSALDTAQSATLAKVSTMAEVFTSVGPNNAVGGYHGGAGIMGVFRRLHALGLLPKRMVELYSIENSYRNRDYITPDLAALRSVSLSAKVYIGDQRRVRALLWNLDAPIDETEVYRAFMRKIEAEMHSSQPHRGMPDD